MTGLVQWFVLVTTRERIMKKKLVKLALLVFTLAMMPLLQGCYDDDSVSYAFVWTPAVGGIFVAGGGQAATGGSSGGGTSGYP